jgi:HEAT repeats
MLAVQRMAGQNSAALSHHSLLLCPAKGTTMQHTHSHHASLHLDFLRVTRSKTRLFKVALVLTAVAIIVMLALPAALRADELIAPLRDASANSASDNALYVFEQSARRLAAAGTDPALESLIQNLKESEPASHRSITIQLLTDAAPQAAPLLSSALDDADPGIRAGAAEVLGLRHEYQAIAALETATHDPKASVRVQAVKSLGDIYAWQDLPRLAELQVNEGNADVRNAAHAAEEMIQARVANEIGVLASQVVAVAVTTANPPRLYAVTKSDLYARRGTTWTRIQSVPDTPHALAVGPDANALYLATESGLYRSANEGKTWQLVSFGRGTPTGFTITALAVSLRDSEQVYAALAMPDATTRQLVGLGVVASSDGGKSWHWLPDVPTHVVTTRLIADPVAPGYLYGLADDTPWRYELASFYPARPSWWL